MWSEDQPGIGEYFRVIFSCLSKVIRDCMGFALLRSVIGPENSRHSQPIRCKAKTNHDLISCVFPRFKQFARFYFEFSLAI